MHGLFCEVLCVCLVGTWHVAVKYAEKHVIASAILVPRCKDVTNKDESVK